MFDKITYVVDRVARMISGWIHSVGVGVLAAMMFLTFADVLLRYVFSKPITGSYELTVYMMAVVVAFGLAYCAVFKGHVTVDVVVNRFTKRAQAIIDSITCLISLGMFCLITWQCMVYIKEEYEYKLASAVLDIPAYPFVGVVALGSLIFCLVLLVHLLEFISQAVRK